MKTTKKTQYALRAMIFIAKKKKEVCSLRVISEKEGISLDYLEKIFSKLEKNNLVISKRGVNGGYVLSRGANKITLKDIFDAVGESISVVDCVSKKCIYDRACAVSSTWKEINKKIEESVSSINLANFLK